MAPPVPPRPPHPVLPSLHLPPSALSAPLHPVTPLLPFPTSVPPQVRLWKVPFAPLEPGPVERAEEAVLQFQGRHPFRAIDHHWRDNLFATAGAAVEVWSHERSEPVNTFSWGADAVLSVRFNPVSLLRASAGRS